MVKTTGQKNYSDVHFTRNDIAKKIVENFEITGSCLEPAKGNGVIYQYLPEGSDWCEISQGRDFFEYTGHVDWIVTNPPFSNLTDWMRKSFEISENVVFLIPISKLFSSAPRMRLVSEYGGIPEIFCLGTGREIGFDIGFPFAAIHFQKGYKGDTKIKM